MTNNKSEMYDYEELEEGRPAELADKSVVYAYGSGNIRMVIYDRNGCHDILFTNVL